MCDATTPDTNKLQPIHERERRIRQRSNCDCVLELAYELRELDHNIKALKNAIEMNPADVRAEAKALWPAQLIAMNDYKKALFARIRDLMDHDN